MSSPTEDPTGQAALSASQPAAAGPAAIGSEATAAAATRTATTGPTPGWAGLDRLTRYLCVASVAGIGSSIVIMIAVSVVRDGWALPSAPLPPTGPPWGFSPHVSLTAVALALWAAVALGGIGVAAGLAAVGRGARPPIRLLIAASLVAVAALAVLPPAGSGDALSYASYGRMAVLDHNPYVMTPAQLASTGDQVARSAPLLWRHTVSVYGPAAAAEQWAAAELGGESALRVTFWLKLWDALAFILVLAGLDRMLRGDPARRARAHLLWSVNPLLLWVLIAAGHADLMAAAAGLGGVVVLRHLDRADQPGAGWLTRLARPVAAGLLAGLAADIKISYLLIAAGIAWALRRSPAALAAAAAALLAVLVPSYLWFGVPSLTAPLLRGDQAGRISFYRFLHLPQQPGWIVLALSAALFLAAAALLLARLPDGGPALPALTPALALSVAWLFTWSYQLPWYDTMAICLLALYPACWLDWLVLARLTLGTLSQVPGTDDALHHLSYLGRAYLDIELIATPVVMLAALAALIWLCRTRAWHLAAPVPAAPA